MKEIIFSRGKERCDKWEDTMLTFKGRFTYEEEFLSRIRNLRPFIYLDSSNKSQFMSYYRYIIVKDNGDLKRKNIDSLSIGSICFKTEEEREIFILKYSSLLEDFTNSFSEVESMDKRKSILSSYGFKHREFGLSMFMSNNKEDRVSINILGLPVVCIWNPRRENGTTPILNPVPRSENDIKKIVYNFKNRDMKTFRSLFVSGLIIQ
jgi:hypothetical protein